MSDLLIEPKRCNICNDILTFENTNPKKGGYLPSRCKKCVSKTRKDARLRSPAKYHTQKVKTWFTHGDRINAECRGRYATDEEYRQMHRDASSNWHYANRDSVLAKQQKTRRDIWYEAIDFFGGGCACCGESTQEFLVVDHIEGGGNIRRREHGERVGTALLKSFKANGWNEAIKFHYRLLCYNCNSAMGNYGYCPHELRQYTRYNLPGEGFYHLMIYRKKDPYSFKTNFIPKIKSNPIKERNTRIINKIEIPKIEKITIGELLENINNGMSIRAICRKYGISHYPIHRLMDKHNITKPIKKAPVTAEQVKQHLLDGKSVRWINREYNITANTTVPKIIKDNNIIVPNRKYMKPKKEA
jgi:hypothetical protein